VTVTVKIQITVHNKQQHFKAHEKFYLLDGKIVIFVI